MSGAFISSPKFPPEPRRIWCLPCHISFPVSAGFGLRLLPSPPPSPQPLVPALETPDIGVRTAFLVTRHLPLVTVLTSTNLEASARGREVSQTSHRRGPPYACLSSKRRMNK
jgi:hypothetical protein